VTRPLGEPDPATGASGQGAAASTSLPHDTGAAPEWMQVWPAVSSSLRPARVALAKWLTILRWPADDADDVIMAVSEAVSNVIDHAYPATRRGPVQLHGWCRSGSTPDSRRVTVTVTDRGDWGREHRTVDPAGHRGHGFAVMSGCTAEMYVQRSAGGTTFILVSNDAPAG
jgi:serine/threonine-protein kinase RsbW